jgi:hypothetical protein
VAAGGAVAIRSSSRSWSIFTLVAGLVAFGAAAAHQVTTLVLEARKLRDPSRVILTRLDQRFEIEHEMIEDIARAHSFERLEHAREGLVLEIAQTRHRVGFLVGAVEQLGLVPAAAAGFLYAHKLLVEKELAGSTLTVIYASVVGLYVAATIFLVSIQRLERLSLVMQQAVERKRKAQLSA